VFTTLFFALALECSPGMQEAREEVAMIRRLNADTFRRLEETRRRLRENDRAYDELRRMGWPLPPRPMPPAPPKR
jgi:hypothetical protein